MFLKYQSIENHYQDKEIFKWLNQFPELNTTIFALQEKVDGANIQLLFQPNEPYLVGKRSGFINKSESFFDIWNTLKVYEQHFKELQSFVDLSGDTLILYGEYYGKGVQKRINYGDTKDFVFFDSRWKSKNGVFDPVNAFSMLVNKFGLPSVPLLTFVEGLTNALEYTNVFPTQIGSSGENAEGFVVKPYNEEYINRAGKRLIFKSKSEQFMEKMYVRDIKKKEPLDRKVLDAYTNFSSYINPNRIASVISKHGPIERPQQLGQYIKWVLEDAKEDFHKDNSLSSFTELEIKKVFNVGEKIAILLKEEINESKVL